MNTLQICSFSIEVSPNDLVKVRRILNDMPDVDIHKITHTGLIRVEVTCQGTLEVFYSAQQLTELPGVVNCQLVGRREEPSAVGFS